MAPRETWTDERLDDFCAGTKREITAVRTEMRAGFERVDNRFDQVDKRFEKVDERFEGINGEFVAVRKEMKDGFDKLHRTLLWFCGSILVVVIASLFTH